MTHRVRDAGRAPVIAITSGKGGVGKTNVVINVAASLARLGHRVGIVDADFGLGNIDVMLGLTPDHHLGHVLSGDKDVDDILVDGPLGIRILPASSGIRELTALSGTQRQEITRFIRRFSEGLDYLFIDTASGISDNVINLLQLADQVIVVTSYDPSAIVDAYAVIKILTQANPRNDLSVIVSAARDSDEAGLVFKQLNLASAKFLKRDLRYCGSVVYDQAVRDAMLAQRPVVDYLPQSPASRCFRILASRLAATPPTGPGLRLAFRGSNSAASVDDVVGEGSQCA